MKTQTNMNKSDRLFKQIASRLKQEAELDQKIREIKQVTQAKEEERKKLESKKAKITNADLSPRHKKLLVEHLKRLLKEDIDNKTRYYFKVQWAAGDQISRIRDMTWTCFSGNITSIKIDYRRIYVDVENVILYNCESGSEINKASVLIEILPESEGIPFRISEDGAIVSKNIEDIKNTEEIAAIKNNLLTTLDYCRKTIDIKKKLAKYIKILLTTDYYN